MSFYDEIEIEDMTYHESTTLYTYPCPCGDQFEISLADLRDGEEVAVCPSCSLMIKVIFEAVSTQLDSFVGGQKIDLFARTIFLNQMVMVRRWPQAKRPWKLQLEEDCRLKMKEEAWWFEHGAWVLQVLKRLSLSCYSSLPPMTVPASPVQECAWMG